MQIITNNIPRPVLHCFELPKRYWKEVDFNPEDSEDDRSFVVYKDNAISLGDFMTTRPGPWSHGLPETFHGWDGYASDSFFSGTLIKLVEDGEMAILATYLS